MPTVRVQRDDFDPGAEAEALARGRTDVGGVASFVCYCRDEGGRLAALELEHYSGMAEEEIARAVAFAFRELKLVVEPGGAVGLAALLAGHLDVAGKTVVVVLSGGNVDPELFARLVA